MLESVELYSDPSAPEYEWVATAISDLTSDDIFVIVGTTSGGSTCALPSTKASSSPSAVAVTVEDGVITSTVTANMKWRITTSSSNYQFNQNGSATNYLYCTNSNTGVRVGSSSDKDFTIDNGYLKNTAKSRYIGIYSESVTPKDWRCYTSIADNIAGQTFTFYKRQQVSTDPFITLDEEEIEAPYTGKEGYIGITYGNFPNPESISLDYYFCDENGNMLDDSEAPDWIEAELVTENGGGEQGDFLHYTISANDGAALTAYAKVYIDEDDYYSIVTFSQAAAPQQYILTVSLDINDNVNAIFVFDDPNGSPLIEDGAAGNVSVLGGTSIEVSPDVAEGYMLHSLLVGGTDVTSQMSGGSYTFTVTGNVTITATAVVNPFATATLTGAQMAVMENAGTTYGTGPDNLKYTTINGLYWEANAWQQSTSSQFLQINTAATNSAAGSYIKLPVFNGKIEEITLTVSNTSRTLYLNTTNSTSNTIATATDGSVANTKVIDMSGVCYQTGYIVVSGGAVQISNISVKYRPYQDMTGTTLETIGNDATVSIPANANVTATNLAIPASSGIVINSGATLTVSGTLTNAGNANNIIVKDGGQLKYYDNGAKDALQATVEKNITGYGGDNTVKTGWYFIASPLASAYTLTGTDMVSGNNNRVFDLYRLNNTTWENYQNSAHASTFTALENGTGYLYASSNNITLSFAGAIKPFTTTGGANEVALADGWNLVGNPYTFNVYSSKSYYKITTNNNENSITAVTNTGDAIAPCMGIVVKSAGTGSVAFTEEPALAWSTGNHGNIQMTLAQTVATRGEKTVENLDNAIVSFNEGSELEKFYFGTQNANIYIPQGNEEYAIASSNMQGEMPVNFVATVDGEYTLTVNAEDVEMNYLHLIDNLTGADIDLRANPSYTFNGSTMDYPSRFRLVFSANNANNENGNDNFAFISNGQIVLTEQGNAMVYDITGRLISSHNNASHITTEGMAAGLYVLQLVNGSDVKTQKIVVR